MNELLRTSGARALSLLAVTAGVVLAACQLVAGVESRSADPEHGGCALPGGAGPQVRVANFVPSSDVVDVCIRAAGGSWGEPLLLNGGTGCGGSGYFASKPAGVGFAYGQVSAAFTAPASTVDVKLVPAGKTCADPGLAAQSGVKLSSSSVTTLVRLGGNGVADSLAALPEAPATTINGFAFRFVNAMPGVGALDLGTPPTQSGGAPTLPTTVASVILHSPVPFGQAPAPGTLGLEGAVNAQGYFTAPGGTMFYLVAGVHGTNPENAVFLMPTPSVQDATFSLYAIGVPHSNRYFQEALICQESSGGGAGTGQNPLLLPCTTSTLPTVTVDVFNTSLYGPSAPAYDARKTYLNTPSTSPIPGRDTDIMCLTELDFLPDIQALVAMSGDAGTNSFPYSYYVQTDETTPFTVSAEQDGAAPPPVTSPPCGGMTDPSAVQSAFQCMEQYCSSTPDAGAGTLTGSTNCLSGNCTGPLGGLLLGAALPTCYDCIVDRVASNQTYDGTYKACTQQNVPPWGFGAQVSQLILSRYPIVATDRFILPSTNYRQAVLYSRVQLPGDLQIDFYCTFLSSTLVAGEVPYVGNYGGSSNNPTSAGADGQYAQEQLYQAQLLAKWVAQKSGTGASGVPAIVAGDWRSGRGPGDGGAPPAGQFAVPVPLVQPTVDALYAAPGFAAATSTQWAKSPQCNFCPESENALNSGVTTGYFVAQPFLYNWPGAGSATVSEGLLYTQPLISSPDVDAAVPPSQYFGVTVSVLRPQQ